MGRRGVNISKMDLMKIDWTWVEPSDQDLQQREPPFDWEQHRDEITSKRVAIRRMPTKREAALNGIASAFDFFGVSRLWTDSHLYRAVDLSASEANSIAIYGDWCAVGADLRRGVAITERSDLRTPRADRRAATDS